MVALSLTCAVLALSPAIAAPLPQQGDVPVYPEMPAGFPKPLPNPDAEATDEASMKRYVERIPGSDVSFTMLPIKGGKFMMGSPAGEEGRKADEGPVHEVELAPFWMEEHELTWDEYRLFQAKLDIELRKSGRFAAGESDKWADAVSRPTPPYVPMDFGMGIEGFPAICMTEFAARHYTKWLSLKTGRFYRLPTEAEWEYACRGGTQSSWNVGSSLNCQQANHNLCVAEPTNVGSYPANAFGLQDTHGNVWEWCLDSFAPYSAGDVTDPFVTGGAQRVLRGGSWFDGPLNCRSAKRFSFPPASSNNSIGFRVVVAPILVP